MISAGGVFFFAMNNIVNSQLGTYNLKYRGMFFSFSDAGVH